MQQVMLFENKEFGEIRTLIIDGQPYFVGKDVAEILGYSNSSKAVSNHVDDEDKQFVMLNIADAQNGNVPIGQSKTAIINESGLYSLILSSKLPTAKKFKRWVTSEVLPSIRKTGGYINGAGIEEIIQHTVAETVKVVVPEVMKVILPLLQEQKEEKLYEKKERRKTSIVSRLDFETRKMIEDMMCSGMYTYAEITKILNEEGVKISLTSVHRYAQSIGL